MKELVTELWDRFLHAQEVRNLEATIDRLGASVNKMADDIDKMQGDISALQGKLKDTYTRAHARIGSVRGLCSDEEPHHVIDERLAELDDLLYAALVGPLEAS